MLDKDENKKQKDLVDHEKPGINACRVQKLYRDHGIANNAMLITLTPHCGTFAGVSPASLGTVLQCCP